MVRVAQAEQELEQLMTRREGLGEREREAQVGIQRPWTKRGELGAQESSRQPWTKREVGEAGVHSRWDRLAKWDERSCQ